MEVQLHSFLFADISGYSAFTEAAGDDAEAEVAISFAALAAHLATAHDAELVHRIGDAVMIHCLDAGEAIQLALRLQLAGSELVLAGVHAGVHTGPALEREGDWWGATVNVAARVAAAADSGQLLATEAAKLAAGELDGARFTELGAVRLRNISAPVRVYLAEHSPARRCRQDATAAVVGP